MARHLPGSDDQTSERAGRIEHIVRRLAAEFRADLPTTIDTLQSALAQQDWEPLRQLVHRIKGIAGSLGYPQLTRLAAPLEARIDAGDVGAIGTGCDRLLTALREVAALQDHPA
jgi:HPt (histidine-containing phosphotransfer) domain-containing protein